MKKHTENKHQSVTLELPKACKIAKIQLIPHEDVLLLTTTNAEYCAELWTELYGQVTTNTDGYEPILYDMPGSPPDNHVIELESDLDELLRIINYLETRLVEAHFVSVGIYRTIKEQVAPELPSPRVTFFQPKQAPQHPAEDETDAHIKKK